MTGTWCWHWCCGVYGTWCVSIGAGVWAIQVWRATSGVCGTSIGTIGAECVGGQGGMLVAAGWCGGGEGVRRCRSLLPQYSSSRAVHSRMDVANSPLLKSVVGWETGSWCPMSQVGCHWIGAVKDALASLHTGMRALTWGASPFAGSMMSRSFP